MAKSKGRTLAEEGLGCGCIMVVFGLALLGAVELLLRFGWIR